VNNFLKFILSKDDINKRWLSTNMIILSGNYKNHEEIKIDL
jgi:hypothetical protein